MANRDQKVERWHKRCDEGLVERAFQAEKEAIALMRTNGSAQFKLPSEQLPGRMCVGRSPGGRALRLASTVSKLCD